MAEEQAGNMSVKGREIYPNMELPLGWQDGWPLRSACAAAPRFAICHFRAGSAVVVLAGVAVLVTAPAIVILDDVIRPLITQPAALSLDTLYFHPSLVNSAFSIESMHSVDIRKASFSGTTKQDFYLLERFVKAAPAERILGLVPVVRERVVSCWENAVKQARQQPDRSWPCRTRSYLLELLFQVRMLESDQSAVIPAIEVSAVQVRINRALQFVQDNYQRDFTVAELARYCGTNRTTLNNEFRAVTGKTIRAYVIGLRMQMAAVLLRDTLLPINEVMSRVGYENQSHFSRAFRALTGMPPSHYREDLCWMIKH